MRAGHLEDVLQFRLDAAMLLDCTLCRHSKRAPAPLLAREAAGLSGEIPCCRGACTV